MLEIRTPELPNDAKAKVIRVNFAEGDRIESGDCLFEIETDKVILEVTAPSDGNMHKNMVKKGDVVGSEQIICLIDEDEDTYHEDVEHLQAQLKRHKESTSKNLQSSSTKETEPKSEPTSSFVQTATVMVCVLFVFFIIVVIL